MKPTQTLLATVVLSTAVMVSGAAQAALMDRGGGLIYDDVLNITWLKDANYGAGSSYDDGLSNDDGAMMWTNAVAWAGNLTYYDSVRNVTYDDWRLPSTLQPDATCGTQSGGNSLGVGCTRSELGHLFYMDLGGLEGVSITIGHNSNFSLFQNIRPDYYWSGTEHTTGYHAWSFIMIDGYQGYYYKSLELSAWAVRPGDVASVPVPAAAWLLGSGLLGLIGVARRQC